MPIREYGVVYSVDDPDMPRCSTLQSGTVKARNGVEAERLGRELAVANGGDFLSTFSQGFAGAARRDMNKAFRYVNPETFVRFDLKHRHKGRPIKGKRNCPKPKRLLSVSIRDVPLPPQDVDMSSWETLS